jgi:hypothetical protein
MSDPIVPSFIDVVDGDGDYLAAHIEMEPCPRCQTEPRPKLHPRVSSDGSAHVADQCLVCGGAWWHEWPFHPRADMLRPQPTKSEAPSA